LGADVLKLAQPRASGRGEIGLNISVEIDRIRTEVNADIAHAISLAEIDAVQGLAELESVRLKYLGKNGIITLLLKEHGKRMRG
jgi:hypothetical protein